MYNFENRTTEQIPLSIEKLESIEKIVQAQVKWWESEYVPKNQKPLESATLEDFLNDVMVGIEEKLFKGIKQITPERISKYLQSIQKEKKLIHTSELKKLFSDDEIRQLTWDLPEGWSYSAPSSSQMTDYRFVDENFDKMVRMQNGCIAYYFYFEPGFRK